MKIEQLSGINNAEQARAAGRAGSNRAGGPNSTAPLVAPADAKAGSDTVYISAKAETIAKLTAQVAALPEVRQERVDSLRLNATSGASHHSAADIADAIIRAEK
jgi:flagellar biosynthesis anti-sigma factor FlgM